MRPLRIGRRGRSNHRAVRAGRYRRHARPRRRRAIVGGLQQQFVVENRAGAGGVTASLAVARMDPDGYNFVVSGIATHAIAPMVNPNTGYDPVKDFTHVAYFGGPPIVFIGAHVRAWGEILAGSRQLREDAQRDVDVRIAWDRYQRAPRCGILRPEGRNQDRAHSLPWGGAGRTGRGCRTSSLRLDDLDDGRRSDRGRHRGPASVSAPTRLADFPSIPTFKEAGYPDLVSTTWFALSGTRRASSGHCLGKINREVIKALAKPRGHGPAKSRADIDRTDDPGGIHAIRSD